MNSMEQRLWEYIDGTCSDKERLAVAALIEQDDSWRNTYKEMLRFNDEISAITPDEPPMGFGYKVMEGVRALEASKPLKTVTNNYIVAAIMSFLILSIIVLMVFAFSGTTPNSGSNQSYVNYFPAISALTSSGMLKAFLYIDVVLLLLLIDGFLRRKKTNTFAKSV